MPEWSQLNRGTAIFYPQRATLTLRSGRILTIRRTGGGNLDIPTFRSGRTVDWRRSGTYSDTRFRDRVRPAGSIGGGVQMTDVFEETIDDELSEEDLDELEALGAAEDADRILGEIDA
jgi:hypothetical protein